jgi:hypothetical protein
MKHAHENPTEFKKRQNDARVKLAYDDVMHIGAWSKISGLAQEPLRKFNEIPADKISKWTITLHDINATYYDEVSTAINVFLIDLQSENTNGNQMTVVVLNGYKMKFVESIKQAKMDAIRELRKERHDIAVENLKKDIDKVKGEVTSTTPTEGSEESDQHKRKKDLLIRLQTKLQQMQKRQSSSEDEEHQFRGGGPEEGETDAETGEGRGTSVDTLAGKYRMDLWGDGRKRTQTRVSDLSLKYL